MDAHYIAKEGLKKKKQETSTCSSTSNLVESNTSHHSFSDLKKKNSDM